MNETRRFDIRQKIFTKIDFLNIGKLFLSEYSSAQKNENHASIAFRVSCADGTSYESETIELFDDGGILDLKRINTLEITFHNYTLESYMNISVVRGGGYSDVLIIRGKDQNWVNGIFTRLKEIIDSLKPQDNFIIRHKTALLHIIAFGTGILIFSILWLIWYRHIEPVKNPSETVKTIRSFFKTHPYFEKSIELFLFWFLGIPWAPYIRSWLLTLWPSIEFDFGPEHLKIEKLRRVRIALVFSIAIIPIVLLIGHDLVKWFFIK